MADGWIPNLYHLHLSHFSHPPWEQRLYEADRDQLILSIGGYDGRKIPSSRAGAGKKWEASRLVVVPFIADQSLTKPYYSNGETDIRSTLDK